MQTVIKMFALLVAALLISFATGWGFKKVYVHESGNAHYTQGVACVVNNTVLVDEYKNLLTWCETKYLENQ